jgi:murein hydrolase activator
MSLLFRLFLVFGISIGLQHVGLAQNQSKKKADLEQRKKENLAKINEIQKVLSKTANQKEANLGQLKALTKKVEAKEQQIEIINEDLEELQSELFQIETIFVQLDTDYKRQKKEYGKMVYANAKTMNNVSALSYLFASDSFYKFFKRYNYVRQINRERERRAGEIQKVLVDIGKKRELLSAKRNQKSAVLDLKVTETQSLLAAKQQKESLTTKLTAKEGKLRAELEERKAAVKALESLVSKSIEKEIARSKREIPVKDVVVAEKKVITKTKKEAKTTEISINKKETAREEKESKETESIDTEKAAKVTMTASVAKLSGSFANNKNRLPWPVSGGFISAGFGSHPHEVLKAVTVPNDGIEIQVESGSTVRSVFDGTVMVVDNSIVGMGTVVAVQHGEYFTIYGKLNDVSVRPGQKVGVHDSLGQVMQGADGSSEIQFQIWKNTSRQNPEKWLRRR